MNSLKIRKVGNSLGITLPQDVLKKLNVNEGDSLHVIETSDGIHLTPYDPDFEQAMQAFDVIRKTYRNALRELAK